MLATLVVAVLAMQPEQIDPPQPGQFERDLTGTISNPTIAQIESICSRVDASGRGQLGVAVVRTTNGIPSRDYATRLFNTWGIGHHDANDGLLLFVALDDHKAEIIIGKGLVKGRVTTAMTDAVMRTVVAHFKTHDPEGALLAGTQALAELLSPPAQSAVAQLVPVPLAGAQPPVDKPSERIAAALDGKFDDPAPRHWVIDLRDEPDALLPAHAAFDHAGDAVYAQGERKLYFVLADARWCEQLERSIEIALAGKGVVVAVDPATATTSVGGFGLDIPNQKINDEAAAFGRLSSNGRWDEAAAHALTLVGWSVHGLPARPVQDAWNEAVDRYEGWMFGGAGVALLGLFFGGRRWNRYRSRTCQCGRARQLLGPIAEDPYLSAAQQTEQTVGSIDYDVWWCASCQDVWINDNVAWFSGFSWCPSCRARTRKTSTTTLSSATEYSTGLQQIDERCQSCSYVNTYTRTTAMLSSSSSSSSSSSDSSFGGGSSSGDGSSGSW